MKRKFCDGLGPISAMRIRNNVAGGFGRARRHELGQAMVELALLLPLFLVLVFGIIEFSRAWAAKHALTIAAREGARILVLPYGAGLPYTTESEVKAAADAAVRGYLNNSGIGISTTTQIIPVKVSPGNDTVMGTGDDVYEKNYTDAVRGERVGFFISHKFDTPLVPIIGLLARDNGQQGQIEENSSNEFRMAATSLMNHE